jgi:hypothetical protein
VSCELNLYAIGEVEEMKVEYVEVIFREGEHWAIRPMSEDGNRRAGEKGP